MVLLHVSLPPTRLVGDILYSQTPQVLDLVTNPRFGGTLGFPAYTPLHDLLPVAKGYYLHYGQL